MYCHHCGADEPEIKIGNKLFCSNCGLPLEKAGLNPIAPKTRVDEEEKSDELTRAFSSMSSSFTDETAESSSSYKSSDLNLINKFPKKSGLESPANKQDLTADIIQQSSPIQSIPSDEPVVENKMAEATETNIEDVSISNVPLVTSIAEIDSEKNGVEKEPISNIENSSGVIEKENITDKNSDAEKEPQKIPVRVNTEEPNEQVSEKRQENKDGELDDIGVAAKKIEKLGDAKRLLDILEKDTKLNAYEEKKEKTKKTYEGAERLIDILKDLPKEEIRENQNEKDLFDKLRSTLETKEISSPLDTPEIKLTKDDFEKTKAPKKEIDEKGILPQKIETKSELPEDSLKEETLPEMIEPGNDIQPVTNLSEETQKEIKSLLDNEDISYAETPIISENVNLGSEEIEEEVKPENGLQESVAETETTKDPADIVAEWKNEEEDPEEIKEGTNIEDGQNQPEVEIADMLKNLETPVDVPEEKDIQNQEEQIVSENSSEDELKNEEDENLDEIHGLGDKTGHIDHWPEEKISRQEKLTSGKEGNALPLTHYFRKILEEVKKDNKEASKEKKKEKRKGRKKKNKVLIITFAFVASVIILSAGLFLFSGLKPANTTEIKANTLKKINFEYKEPGYIPLGFEETGPFEAEDTSFTTTFKYVADKNKNIRIKQSVSSLTETEILNSYVLAKGTEYLTEVNNKIKFFYFKNEVTFTNGKVWFVINSDFDLDQSELKKIGESLL